MARVLFAGPPVWSHVNPTIAIAQRLQECGHTVAYACHPQIGVRVEKAGLEVVEGFHWGETMLKAQRLMESDLNRWMALIQATRGLPTGIYFHDLDKAIQMLIEILRSWKPDVLVTDLMLHAGPTAAEACGVPYATTCAVCLPVSHSSLPPYGFGLSPRGRPDWRWRTGKAVLEVLLRTGDRPLNRVRRKLGLSSQRASFFAFSPYLVLAFTTEAFEYAGVEFPRQVYLVGPSISEKRGDSDVPFPWEWLNGQPGLYATLGTLNTGRIRFFEKVIEASRGEPWQMVLSAGRNRDLLERNVKIPKNVLLRDYVPQPKLLSRVRGVLSHGGNITVMEALAAGLPLVVFPIGADQPEVAQRVVEAGAGLRLKMPHASALQIKAAIRRLLEDSNLSQNAERIAADYARCDAPAASSKLLLRLVEKREPLLRHPDRRATVYAEEIGEIP